MPCKNKCYLDLKTNTCTGCKRTIEEIKKAYENLQKK